MEKRDRKGLGDMKRTLAVFLVLALILCGCAREIHQNDSALAPSEQEKLVIYTSHSKEVYEPIIREFEQRTGIWVQVKDGGSLELLDEIAAGETDCDLLFGGGIDSIGAYRDCFDPYVSPLAGYVADEFRVEGEYCTPFSSLPIVMIYNPKLIRLNMPDGWDSLLDPKWKGQIAFADPNLSSSSCTALCTMIQALSAEPEALLAAFYENLDGRILEESKLIVNAVSEGSYYIGIALEESALKGVAAGCDIEIVYPREGTSAIPDGAAIVSGCAHPENAKIFIDFLLGTDVQTYLQDTLFRHSVRKDISEESAKNKNLVLMDYDLNWSSGSLSSIRGFWSALSGEGTK